MTLYIHSYATASPMGNSCDTMQGLAWPKPGTNRRGGRIPKLAVDLAKLALAEREPDPKLAILFGTALGALTETELFVSHMIAADEATPKPRAFTASVHNAIASQTALALGARGDCLTFVHRDLALAHCLFAAESIRRRDALSPILVGCFDEAPSGSFAKLAGVSGETSPSPAGSVFLLDTDPVNALARLDSPAFGRPAKPEAWLRDESQALPHRWADQGMDLASTVADALSKQQSCAVTAKSDQEYAVLRLRIL